MFIKTNFTVRNVYILVAFEDKMPRTKKLKRALIEEEKRKFNVEDTTEDLNRLKKEEENWIRGEGYSSGRRILGTLTDKRTLTVSHSTALIVTAHN